MTATQLDSIVSRCDRPGHTGLAAFAKAACKHADVPYSTSARSMIRRKLDARGLLLPNGAVNLIVND